MRAFANRTYDVDFKRAGNAKLPGDERAKLVNWYLGLSILTRKRIKLGKQPLRLEAFASQTQPAAKNQTLAEARMKAVIDVIGRFVSPDNWAKHATAYGEDLLPDERKGKEQEDPSMWRVHLAVVDEVTPDADDTDIEDFGSLMPE